MTDPHIDFRHIARRDVPVVDISALPMRSEQALQSIAAEWAEHMESNGCLCLVNHDFPLDVIHQMELQSQKFHSLPLSEKLKIEINLDQRGFVSANRDRRQDDLTPGNTASAVLVLATEYDEQAPHRVSGKQFYGSNQWPVHLAGFKETALTYMGKMTGFGKSLLPIWSRALHLEGNFFNEHFDNNYTYFRMAHYPAQKDATILASNSHVDAGFMTISPKANVEGLQIKGANGEWFWPEMPEDSLLVHTGAFLEKWSNGQFKAMRHRVVAHENTARYANPCFINPGFEAKITVLTGDADPEKLAAGGTTFWDYFSTYMYQTYSHYNKKPESIG